MRVQLLPKLTLDFGKFLAAGTGMDKLRVIGEIEGDAPTVKVQAGSGGDDAQVRVEVTREPPSETEKKLVEELFDWLFTEANKDADSELIAA